MIQALQMFEVKRHYAIVDYNVLRSSAVVFVFVGHWVRERERVGLMQSSSFTVTAISVTLLQMRSHFR